MNRLEGKVALISGAARGIGGESAKLMAREGAWLVVADVLDEAGRQTVEEIRAAGGQADYVHLDVTREEDWTTAIEVATGRFGKLDVLVNNAGVFIGKPIEEISLEEWNKLVAVNMTGVFLGTKLAAPALREAAKSSEHGSAIVNLASIAGLVGSQLDPLYSMTKGGVTLFTKSSALEFGRKGYRIRVNSIHPGVIQTEMGEQTFMARARRTGSNDPAPVRQQVSDTIPWGRLGVPLDIAKGVAFLASDDAAYMNGAGLVVDGGFTAA
ncbi:glucose 1-dehydrogenase [Dankookia sp. P2]|uniref:glucose 1-dehydrogenase n=1 Tax=Dankookia sp. P2 TaxID=3423955 RepID=UPI003D67296B